MTFHAVRAAAALLAALALAACSSAPPADPNAPALGPLVALPPCDPPPTAVLADVEGVVLPEGTRITSVVPQDVLTNVMGYVEKTPVEIRVELEGRGDLEILSAEDEIFEAEALVSDGEHRTYLRASAICSTGSTVLAVVAPELSAGALPVPASAQPVTGG